MAKKILIVGAGFGGLATAALLAKDGHQVTLVEKNDGPGGRAMVWKESGFTFDLGPSWYLMRDVFNRFYAEFGKKDSDFFDVVRLDPAYRIFFGNGEKEGAVDSDQLSAMQTAIEVNKNIVDIPTDLDKNVALFDSLEPNGGKKFLEYLEKARKIYDGSMDAVVYPEMHSIMDFVKNPELRKSGKDLPLLENIDNYVNKYFTSDRARKILEYSIVFLGGSPKNTPAIYSLMSHVNYNLGVWFPMGGIAAVVSSIEKIGRDLGVEYIYDCEVSKVNVADGIAKEVVTNKGNFSADLVVMNGDMVYSETKLLEPKYQTYPEKYWKNKLIAPSAFMIYLGLNKKLKNLAHHSLFFANDWITHFNEIFDNPQWPTAPSYYVNCPTKTDASLAPDGCENIFILVPVASDMEDTAEVREEYAKKMIEDFEKNIGEEITSSIMVRRVFSQRDFKAMYHAYKGTSLGLSHTLMQSSIFRPSHQSKKVKNLLYVGQYTNPGIGMPMCLISAMQVRTIVGSK
jgi:phytoene desaturase